MSNRNRSEGWRHAKISGHKYEHMLADEINYDTDHPLREFIEEKWQSKFIQADSSFGTSHLPSILDDKTTSKSDVVVNLESGKNVGISIKKSKSGQVWITSLSRFIDCCNFYGIEISDGALWSLATMTNNLDNQSITETAPLVEFTTLHKSGEFLEQRDNRLLAKSIAEFYPKNWDELVSFFQKNYRFIVEMAFSRGLNATKDGIAELIYYREGQFFTIEEICNLKNVELIDTNSKNRNTIWLPFGFMQVHRPTAKGKSKSGPFSLQFHHNLDRINQNRF